MSITPKQQQALTLAIKAGLSDVHEAAAIVKWSDIELDQLRGYPSLEVQKKHFEARLQQLENHPQVEKELRAIASSTPRTQQQNRQQANVARAAFAEGVGNHTLQGQTPQQRSITPQQAQVQQGPGGVVRVDLTKRSIASQVTPPPGAYVIDEPQQDLTTKALLENIQREAQQLPYRIARELEKHQRPKKVTKAKVVKGQTPAQREAARLMGMVQRSRAAKNTVVVVEKSAPAPVFNPANPDFSLLPPLPRDHSGQPSINTAIVRANTGLGVHPILHCDQFHQNQFLAMQRGGI